MLYKRTLNSDQLFETVVRQQLDVLCLYVT